MTLEPIGSRFRALAFTTALCTFALVIIGGIVRLTGSGMGCPDWPLCYGQLIPPFEFHTLIEYFHRLFGVLVAFAVFAVGMVTVFKFRRQRVLYRLAGAGVLLLISQVVLGGITVLTGNAPWTVTLHLGNALILFAVMLVLTTVVYARRAGNPMPPFDSTDPIAFARMTTINAAGVFILILSGSYVVGAGATGACVSYPLCDNDLLPTDGLEWIHMAHRLIAALVGVYLILTCVRAQRHGGLLQVAGRWTLWLFVAQVLVGGANVLLGFPIVLNALHFTLAAAVWGAAVVLAVVAQIQAGARWVMPYIG